MNTVAIMACRPVRFTDYPPEVQALVKKAEEKTGEVLRIYPDSVYENCEDCCIEVAVGPGQQKSRTEWQNQGVTAVVLCMLCAVVAARAQEDAGFPVKVQDAGNPYEGE